MSSTEYLSPERTADDTGWVYSFPEEAGGGHLVIPDEAVGDLDPERMIRHIVAFGQPARTAGRHPHVIAAIAAVMEEMRGVAKDDDSSQGYKYRGIEAITAEAQHLLGKHCVVFVPRVLERDVEQMTINSRPWTQDVLKLEYDVYGPGGINDKITVGPIYGLGRDNSDKGTNKCQPTGTMVRVPTGGKRGGHADARYGWTEIPIESIRQGDKVVSWTRERSAVRPSGRTVTGVAARPYDGKLVTVTTADRSSSYTPNHRCLVRLPDRLADGNEIVCLMRRGDQYRIGRTRWRAAGHSSDRRSRLGLAWRCAAEQADAAWVLSVHATVAEAAMAEALASVRFGIPQTGFTGSTDIARPGRPSAFDLDVFWQKVGDNAAQAAACLSYHSRLIDRPLYTRTPGSQVGTLPTIETAAANLLSGMLVGIPGDTEWKVEWEPATISERYYSGLVHSMDVAVDRNYIGDGLLTGNSMTQAFKYALLQVLCVGDSKDDGDREEAHVRDSPIDEETRARQAEEAARRADESAQRDGWANVADWEERRAAARAALKALDDARTLSHDAAGQAWAEFQRPDGSDRPARPRTKGEYDAFMAALPPLPAPETPTAEPAAASAPESPPDTHDDGTPPDPASGPEEQAQVTPEPAGEPYRDALDALYRQGDIDNLMERIKNMPMEELGTALSIRGVATPSNIEDAASALVRHIIGANKPPAKTQKPAKK